MFTNYTIYGIPFTKVDSTSDFENIREGVFAGDELWNWCDARLSSKAKNRVVSTILLKSRKRDLTVLYTAQSFDQIDKRIRKITDFIAYPMLNRDNSICKVILFRGSKPSPTNIIQTMYFKTAPIYQMYDSTEEVGELIEGEDAEPMKEIFFNIKDNPALYKKVA